MYLKPLILCAVIVAMGIMVAIPAKRRITKITLSFGGLLVLTWAYQIYLDGLPNRGGYGFGTSIWMYAFFTAAFLIVAILDVLLRWPRSREIAKINEAFFRGAAIDGVAMFLNQRVVVIRSDFSGQYGHLVSIASTTQESKYVVALDSGIDIEVYQHDMKSACEVRNV